MRALHWKVPKFHATGAGPERQGEVETSRATLRPLLAAALAFAVGGWGGTELVFSTEIWRALALGSLAAAALALVFGPVVRLAGACAILAAFGGLRADFEARRPPESQGRFEPLRTLDGTVRGRLAPGRMQIEFAEGLVEPGEHIEFRGGARAAERARGPIPAPKPRSDAPRYELLPDEILRLAPPSPGFATTLARTLDGWRRTLRERLGRIEDRDARSLALALVLGDLGGLDPQVPDLFVRTGTFHALAVSGVQVVLVASLLLGPLASFAGWLARGLGTRRARLVREIVRGLAILAYVPVAGAGPPVARAALACVLANAAPLVPTSGTARVESGQGSGFARLMRRADGLSLWSLALIVECVLHPRAAGELSVQLSYSATLGLVLATAPIRRVLSVSEPAAFDALGRRRSPILRALRVRLQVGVTSALAASIAAVLATLPFVWWRLGEWSPLGIVATLAIAAPAALLLVGGWIAALAPGLVPEIVLVAPARAILASLRVFDTLPGTPDSLPPRPLWLVAGAVALAFAALVLRAERSRDRSARVAAIAFAILLVPWTTAPRELEVHALDVGHGTCCIVRAPGLGTWVFDAGSRDRSEVARAALGPALRAFDPGEIGIVLSHPDRDHDGALPWLASRFDVVCHAGAVPARLAERLPHTARRFDLATGRGALPNLQGSCVEISLTLERGLDVPGNEGSRTLSIHWFGAEILLAGDAEAEGLRAWLSARAAGASVRLLLAPHHGSEIERLGLLLDAVDPAEVWISGLARPPIAGELERRRIPWSSTGSGGPLVLRLAAPEHAAWWNGTCLETPP